MQRNRPASTVYDTTLFCDTLASDTETVDEGSIGGDIEVSRPMADHWCETAYVRQVSPSKKSDSRAPANFRSRTKTASPSLKVAEIVRHCRATVVRQDVNRIHKSVHTSYPVVKAIRLSPSKAEHSLRENGLMRSQLEIRINNGTPEPFTTSKSDEHNPSIQDINFEPVQAEQVPTTESTLGYSSSETIYSTGTFQPKHAPRTYVDCVIHGSIDEPSLSNPPPAPLQQRTPSPPINSHKVKQQSVRIVHEDEPVQRETSPPLTDSEKNTQSADSPRTVDTSDPLPSLNSKTPSGSGTPTNGSLDPTGKKASDFIPYYPRRKTNRPLSIVTAPPRFDKSRCFACQKIVYPLEGVHVMDRVFHKSCFRCHKCQRILSVRTFNVGEGHPYCEPHYTELFRVRGRYGVTGRGKSAEDDDDFLLHQTAIQSSTSSETAKERPPPQVTRKLVAKFQQLSELSRSTQDLRIVRPLSLTPEGPATVSDVRSRSMSLGKQPIPTPFLQALQPREESPRKSQ